MHNYFGIYRPQDAKLKIALNATNSKHKLKVNNGSISVKSWTGKKERGGGGIDFLMGRLSNLVILFEDE